MSNYRRILADNLREYGEGTRHLAVLGRLYTDRTHFLFELLQNAEDARATLIRFELHRDRLEVWHDGRPFEEGDVRGVCGVGETTKREDLTQIGKFGVGFKSVYAYTATPEVHSGHEHFRIEGFVRPIGVTARPLPQPWTTLQVFPFDHAEITPEIAFAEIGKRLETLSVRTLLFLRHVATIEWSTAADARGTYLRENKPVEQAANARRVELLGEQHGRPDADEHWLVFERPVLHPDGGGPIRVEAAFHLGIERSTDTEIIVPIRESQLVVFFPTEKETHLGFLIQGPYRTTPARDNIPTGDQWNRRLVEETATLVVDSLHQIRELGFLTASLLQTLPIRNESFAVGTMFRPIFDRVRAALREQPLLPVHGGGFVAARDAKIARRGEASLLEVFSPCQLADLFERPGELRWLSMEISDADTPELYRYLVGQRARYSPLYHEAVDALVEDLEVRVETVANRITPRFLERQEDAWFSAFYTLLSERRAAWPTLRTRSFLRLEDGKHVSPFQGENPNAYLPPQGATNLPIVKRAIAADEAALRFLKDFGLEEPDIIAEVVEQVLPKYRLDEPKRPDNDDEIMEDFQRIMDALGTDSRDQKQRLIKRLQGVSFLKVRNPATARECLVRPHEAYLGDARLLRYFEGNEDCWFLDYGEAQLGDPAIQQSLLELGVADRVRLAYRQADPAGHIILRNEHSNHKRGLDGFDPDCAIDGLEHALSYFQPETARLIWNTLLLPTWHSIRGIVERSSRRTYENATRRAELSVMGCLTVEAAWLPDRRGVCHRPSELSLEDLPDGFERNEDLAKALGMRASEARLLATKVGIDPDDLPLLQAHAEELKEFIHSLRQRTTQGMSGPVHQVNVADNGHPREQDLSDPGEEFDPNGGSPPNGALVAESATLDYRAELVSAFARAGRTTDVTAPVPAGPVGNPALRRERTLTAVIEGRAAEPPEKERFKRVPAKVWERKDSGVRTFLAQQYGGQCQVCGDTFHRRDGAPYFEGLYVVPRAHARWIDRPGNVLCLCATCCAKFQHGVVEADDITREIAEYRMVREGGDTRPELHVRLCGLPTVVRFTEAHLLDLQELLRASTIGGTGDA